MDEQETAVALAEMKKEIGSLKHRMVQRGKSSRGSTSAGTGNGRAYQRGRIYE